MARCDQCGNESTLPFTCQYCGGKFCADCRLPPNHDCTGIGIWNKKPRPSVGMSYTRNGRVSASGNIAAESRGRLAAKEGRGFSLLWIMAAIVGLVLLALLWLALGGYRL